MLNLLLAAALLLWGTRQIREGLCGASAPWAGGVLRHARRGKGAALILGTVAGALCPAGGGRLEWAAEHAGAAESSASRAFALLLGANLGGAAAMLLLTQAPLWSFHALTIAGAAAWLQTRHAGAREWGRALLGAGFVLLALRILEIAAAPMVLEPLAVAVTQALAQDALLALTAGAVLAAGLRSSFVAVLVVAGTSAVWLAPQSAVAALVGVYLGGAALAYAGSGGRAEARRLGAVQLLAAVLTAGASLLLRADLAHLLAEMSAARLLVLNLGIQALAAAVFVNLADPLTRAMQRWLPLPAAGAADAAPRLHARDLEVPSVALAAALRELMRVADLVDRMLRLTRDVFVKGDAAAASAARDVEQQVNALYKSLKQYLTQIPRRPLRPAEETRWEELLAFLVAVEQVADRLDRVLDDLARKKVAQELDYPAAAQAEILALHEKIALNLRLAASVCLDRGTAAAHELVAAKDTFRQLEHSVRAAHVERLVAGDAQSASVSALHFNLLADYVDMNDLICAFGRRFLSLHATPAPAEPGGRPRTPLRSALP